MRDYMDGRVPVEPEGWIGHPRRRPDRLVLKDPPIIAVETVQLRVAVHGVRVIGISLGEKAVSAADENPIVVGNPSDVGRGARAGPAPVVPGGPVRRVRP